MGWWEADNQIDILGDGPADTLSTALQDVSRMQGRRLTLQEFLDSLLRALLINPQALLLDGDLRITDLTARLNDGRIVSSSIGDLSDGTLDGGQSVKIVFQALEDIVTDYEDMEDHRKPRLSELLATAAFILGPDDQDFIDTAAPTGVDSITPSLVRHVESE